MKKNLFFALVFSVAVFMYSCGGHSAIYVNDTIVDKTDKVEELMSKVYDFVNDDKYDNALAYLDSIANHAKESETIIANLEYKPAEKFQQAALEYLAMYKEAATTDFRQAIEWYQSEDNALLEKANNLIRSFDDKTDKKLAEMQALQVEFANKNNFDLKH